MLKPLDFILCTLCRGDDFLEGGGSKTEKEGRKHRGCRKKGTAGDFFRVPKDALI